MKYLLAVVLFAVPAWAQPRHHYPVPGPHSNYQQFTQFNQWQNHNLQGMLDNMHGSRRELLSRQLDAANWQYQEWQRQRQLDEILYLLRLQQAQEVMRQNPDILVFPRKSDSMPPMMPE